jgi:transcriptional regulator with XRE-family HTH domain
MGQNISTANIEKQQHCCLPGKKRVWTIPRMAKRVFTPADWDAQKRLKTIWEAKKGPLGLTQENVMEALDMNQSAVSQYLNGKVPLRLAAALKFSRLLKVKPTEIRPDLAELTSEVSTEALDWAQRFDKLDERGKQKFWDALLVAEKGIPDENLEHLRAPASSAAKKRKTVAVGG